MAEQNENSEPFGGTNEETASSSGQVDKLRTMVNQASRSIKDMTQASGQWAQDAQGRAREVAKGLREQGARTMDTVSEVAKDLREQGSRTIGTVSETVEHNPLTSLAVAFAVGFMIARLTKR